MQFGFFDDGRREYVIETPPPPQPRASHKLASCFLTELDPTFLFVCLFV